MRAILHLDMDAFYASVEQRDDPSLRGKPVIVGGHPTRGVVLAASYEVRPFGVRSAMPMARAVRLAPNAIVVPPRFSAYAEASERVFALLHGVTPLVEPLSLDEAFLDVTESRALLGAPGPIAAGLRARIRSELELPASAGIAATKFVAKIASDLAKPNGQREIPEANTVAFLAPLAVSRLWGVGPKTEETLRRLDIATIGDVASRGERWCVERLGDGGRRLWELSQGIDPRPVVPDREAKSVGAEDTFEQDTADLERLRVAIHDQAWRVGRRLRRAELAARVVDLKLKFADFRVVHRQQTLPAATDDGQVLYRAALELLERVAPTAPVRLTGVSAAQLTRGGQLGLFREKGNPLNAALDRITEKYGSRAVVPADLAQRDEGRVSDADDEARRLVGAAKYDRRTGGP